MIALFSAAIVAASALATAASAQSPDGPVAGPPKLDPKACSDGERLWLGDTHETQGRAIPADDPGKTLARTDGVICPPPEIDPDLQRPPPGGSAMPVIPAPENPPDGRSIQPE
jgi:hypothetical protein